MSTELENDLKSITQVTNTDENLQACEIVGRVLETIGPDWEHPLLPELNRVSELILAFEKTAFPIFDKD